jgi:hypothetical protein
MNMIAESIGNKSGEAVIAESMSSTRISGAEQIK